MSLLILSIIQIIKAEGLLRNSLFLIKKFGWIVKFIKGPLVNIFSIIDKIFIKLFKESQIIIIAKK